jgi:hypothetical protein
LGLTGIGSTAGLVPAGISQGTHIGYLRITPANQIEAAMKTGTREYHMGGTSVPLISGAPIARSHIVIPNW